MPKKRIIISVISDLATDQRVQKTASTLFQNGFDVLLIGRELPDSRKINFPYKTKRFRLFFNHSFLFYAEMNIRLFFFLLFSKSDILLANDTDTLPANYFVSKIKEKKLMFDSHELFPEVPELINRPFVKKFWTKIEDYIFPKLKYSYTVCQSISDYYRKKYEIKMEVIRNVPYLEKTDYQIIEKKEKTILYQGALNKGRGLEWLLEAMPFIDAKLTIIGDGDIKNMLIKKTDELGLQEKVSFLDKMFPADLRKWTQTASLGLCLLKKSGLSYYYSLPNRIFDYIHAEIPVLATDFPEIRNIVQNYKTGVLIDHYEPAFLAETINKILSEGFDTSHFSKAAEELCWQNEEKILLKLVNEA